MALCIVSCGIFQPELEKLLPEIGRELNCELEIGFVPPALHVDYKKLAEGIYLGLERFTGRNVLMLYGSMCHPDLPNMMKDVGALYLKAGNCIDAMVSPESKAEFEKKYGKLFYMTAGWLRYWRDIFQKGMGWDTIDARMNMGFYDQVIVLDSGIYEISDEELIEFYEFTQVPVDVEPITLDYFRGVLLGLCADALSRIGETECIPA
ncbi:MAG: DUF1638 domain-containing protein [Synergistaceae bacterium]|jgi:hypothetical protein|nr:DUF1638 domain-containing protein [Synergistaceae bacterium]